MCTRITRPLKSTGFASPPPEATRNRLPGLVKARDQPDLPPSADEPTISNIRSAQDKTGQPLIMQEAMPQVKGGAGVIAGLRICRCLSMPDDMLPLRMCGFRMLIHAILRVPMRQSVIRLTHVPSVFPAAVLLRLRLRCLFAALPCLSVLLKC